MQKARLTIDCIKKFKPTTDKYLLAKCDDKWWVNGLSTIKVIGWNEEQVIVKGIDNVISVLTRDELKHFPSPYQPVRRYRALWYWKNAPNLTVSRRYYESEETFYKAPPSGRVLIKLIKDDYKDE